MTPPSTGPTDDATTPAPAGAAPGPGAQPPLAISVVLPTHQRRESVLAAVRALLADDLADSEVVVVDDGSSDGTLQALQEVAATDPRLVVLHQANAGKRVANATATARARGRVLLFLDDDVLPGPGLLRGHARAHEGRDDLVVVGYMPTVVPRPTTGAAFATVLYAREYEGRCEAYDADPGEVLEKLWMGNVSLTRAGYERAGLASLPAFRFRHEDRDIGLACRAAGLVGVFDRSLAATHQHSRTVDQFVRDSRQQGGGRAALAVSRGEGISADAEQFTQALPAPLAALVRAARRPAVRTPVAAVLTAALRGAATLPDVRPALAVAKLLRRVELQRGLLEELDRSSAARPAGHQSASAAATNAAR